MLDLPGSQQRASDLGADHAHGLALSDLAEDLGLDVKVDTGAS